MMNHNSVEADSVGRLKAGRIGDAAAISSQAADWRFKGAIRTYEDAVGRCEAILSVPDVRAEEEAAVRRNAVKRTTELLEKVFGAGKH